MKVGTLTLWLCFISNPVCWSTKPVQWKVFSCPNTCSQDNHHSAVSQPFGIICNLSLCLSLSWNTVKSNKVTFKHLQCRMEKVCKKLSEWHWDNLKGIWSELPNLEPNQLNKIGGQGGSYFDFQKKLWDLRGLVWTAPSHRSENELLNSSWVLQDNDRVSVHQLKLGRNWMMQQHNYHNHLTLLIFKYIYVYIFTFSFFLSFFSF